MVIFLYFCMRYDSNLRPMRRFLMMVCAQMLCVFSLMAGVVTEDEALLRAKAFLTERGRQPVLRAASALRRAPSTANRSYYVYNIGENSGFVLVSGDDRTPAILGYADEGAWQEERLPEALRDLLRCYEAEIEWLDGHETSLQPARRAIRQSIAPMVTTHWDQGAPYNQYCPDVTYKDANDQDKTERTVTGCVATSMAQVMNFHQWPAGATQEVAGYTTVTRGLELSALPATTFDWSHMSPTYGGENTAEEKAAVAELMQYCGASIRMNYNISSVGGSSAYNACVAEALKTFFGYDNGVDYVSRRCYSYTDWIDLIYSELAARRPVILGGQSCGGGHSFVCDGYEGDDFFHINWGWSGSSDGFFRMSALSPYVQGIGGSSTLDGFSFSQEAVIGIQPRQSGDGHCSLSLEGLQFTASDASLTSTYHRASFSEDFTGVALYVVLCNYSYNVSHFDYAVQLVDDDGMVRQTLMEETAAFSFNSDVFVSSNSLSIDHALPNGTYSVRVVCREKDADYWQTCYGATSLPMTVTIAGNDLTLSASYLRNASESLSCGAIQVSDTPLQGQEVTVMASITGGVGDYHDNLFLYVNGKRVMGRQSDIPAGETVQVKFAFTPSEAGSHILYVCSKSSVIGSKEISVGASDATLALTLGLSATIHNIADEKLYGNGIRATVTLTNTSADYRYVGTMNCSVRTWSGESYSGVVTRYPVEVPKSGSVDVPIVVDGLQTGATYSLRITYLTSEDGVQKTAANDFKTERYVMDEGFSLYAADGSSMLLPKTDAIDAGDALCLDLSMLSATESVTLTPSSNDNCLYLLAADATVPAVLSGKNVVKGDAAASITLTDEAPFFSPIAFTASAISYHRTFSLPASGSGGWNTLMLPFDVAEVRVGEKQIDWFRSASDTGKHFWLKAFTGDDDDHVYFDFASSLRANTPYIIAVPGDTWGEEWQLTGKEMTFLGTDASVKPTQVESLSGNQFKFNGSTLGETVNDVFALNASGSSFKKQDACTLAPFRAWIEASDISSLALSSLRIASGVPNAIHTATKVAAPQKQYDLLGRQGRAGRGGLRIEKGRKFLQR